MRLSTERNLIEVPGTSYLVLVGGEAVGRLAFRLGTDNEPSAQ